MQNITSINVAKIMFLTRVLILTCLLEEIMYTLFNIYLSHACYCYYYVLFSNIISVLFSDHEALLKGHFHFADAEDSDDVQCACLPLAVAASTGSKQSLLSLLHHGISTTQTDCQGNNVIHSLIIYSYYHSQYTTDIVEQYHVIMSHVDQHTRQEMLCQENQLRLRPLEFAAQNGQAHLVSAILNTPGKYLTREIQCGVMCYKWYDITEYVSLEPDNRAELSPILYLTFLEEDENLKQNLFIYKDKAWLKEWSRAKFLVNLPLIVLWFLLRASLILGYCFLTTDMVHNDNINGTQCNDNVIFQSDTSRIIMASYLVLHATLSLLLVAYESYDMGTNYASRWYSVKGVKLYTVQINVYYAAKIFFNICVIVFTPLMFFNDGSNETISYLLDCSHFITPLLAVLCILFFAQIIPALCKFVSSLYYIMGTLIHFIAVYSINILAFLVAFQNFINSNTEQGCIEGFQNYAQSFYSMFLIMLNMIDLTQYRIRHPELLYLVHFSYTFIVSIMLLNFFIAIVSSVIMTVNRINSANMMIQRASLVFLLENRVRRILKPYYKYMNKKCFRCHGDRMYVVEKCLTKTEPQQRNEIKSLDDVESLTQLF